MKKASYPVQKAGNIGTLVSDTKTVTQLWNHPHFQISEKIKMEMTDNEY